MAATRSVLTSEIGSGREPVARHLRILIALMLGLALWFAHFGKAVNYLGQAFPTVNPTLDWLMDNGRSLSLACQVAVLVLYVAAGREADLRKLRAPILLMVALNLYLSAKLVFYGNFDFFIGAILVVGLSTSSLVVAVGGLERDPASGRKRSVSTVVQVAWLFGALVAATNLAAMALGSAGAINDSLRLHGVTVNPQHLGMMCALSSPAVIYGIRHYGVASLIGLISAFVLLGLLLVEYYTGSRGALASTAVGALIFYRNELTGSRMIPVWGGLFLLFMILSVTYFDILSKLIVDQFVVDRFDTRSVGWERAWQRFLEDPVFGAPPDPDTGRLAFVENVLVAAASTGGLIAAGLALAVYIGLTAVAFGLHQAIRKGAIASDLGNMYVAALAVIMLLGLLESVFLGLIAAHTMLCYLYVGGASNALVSVNRKLGRRDSSRKFASRIGAGSSRR